METYLFGISMAVKGVDLDDRIIKSCTQHMESAVKGSTLFYFEQNDFYQELPPRLQLNIVTKVLVNEMETFSFFF